MNENCNISLVDTFNEVYQDVKQSGLQIPDKRHLMILFNQNIGRAWGTCTKNWSTWNPLPEYDYIIRFSKTLCQHCRREAIMSTMAHELIHAAGINGHRQEFKRAAAKIMMAYPGKYMIKRCTSASEKMDEASLNEAYTYVVECPNCHKKWFFKRASKLVKHSELYRCNICGHSSLISRKTN